MVTAYFIRRRRSDAQTNRGKQENRGPFDAGDGIKVRASFLFGVSSSVERANSQERYEWPQNTPEIPTAVSVTLLIS